ncbi:nicotinamidase-related amidase [Nocardia tenerifensis]|uniref:Nicotinamidase-related amidase n=1 Tax=Nocardia tenerifensis TaxID=228006 RepID=A0A318K410_9NOCA|nr:cysteine hydrolase [Nocardia tenerifensis]PXX65610.1 nicotinamidase-related amidase [Nocardia tenerifensis]
MATPRIRAAVLALHWQVNVIEPEGFFGPMLAGPVAAAGVVARAVDFHDAAAAQGIPVIFTRFTIPVGEGQLVRNTGFMRSVGAAQTEFRPDSPGSQIIARMAGQAGEVFDTQKLSGLAGNTLAQRLSDANIDTLFLTGVATNLTVAQTARHGTDLGFTVHTVADCTAAVSPEAHEAALADLELVTAGSLPAARALEMIGRR